MTSLVEILLRCPGCNGFNRASDVASTSFGATLIWTDGFDPRWPAAVSCARCACCGAFHRRSAFDSLGVLSRDQCEYRIRLVALGDEPVKIMRHLRIRFGWNPVEVKSRISALPVDLPLIRYREDAQQLLSALQQDGASCEMSDCVIEKGDPPERLDAPWLEFPREPSELAGFIPRGAPDERDFRAYLYRLSNDPYRQLGVAWTGLMSRTLFEIENIRLLIDLLDMDDEAQWLLRASIARESGDFTLAGDLLDQRLPLQHAAWHSALRALVAERVERVAPLSLDEGP